MNITSFFKKTCIHDTIFYEYKAGLAVCISLSTTQY
jgi:hypothetical protein